jgi:transposase
LRVAYYSKTTNNLQIARYYSVNLNPIEKLWANMKRWIEYNILNFNAIFDAILIILKYLIQPNLNYHSNLKVAVLLFNSSVT